MKDMIMSSVEITIDPEVHLYYFELRALGYFTNHCTILLLLHENLGIKAFHANIFHLSSSLCIG
jgi:hypothetical protein